MANIIINEKKRTIEMSKKDYASACKFGTEKYKELQEARRAYPNYRVIAVTICIIEKKVKKQKSE